MTVKHKPYIEHIIHEPTNQYLTGGMDTTSYDEFRQGVSIRTSIHAYDRIMPKMWSGDITHVLQKQVFGVSGMYSDGDAYDDLKIQFSQIDVINYMASGAIIAVSEEFYGAGDDDGNIESYDGVIEPFTLRKLVINLDRTERNRIRAYYSLGNYSRWESVDDVRQEYEYDTQQMNAYKDINELVDEFGNININVTGSALYRSTKLTVEDRRYITPFNDTDVFTKWNNSNIVSNRSHLLSAYLQLQGSTE
jgi:hypothetical protein